MFGAYHAPNGCRTQILRFALPCGLGKLFPVTTSQPIESLYVHVPFCAHKCEYCAFYSEASQGEVISRYVSALVREIELVAHDLKPQTVFFGGGTPSILTLKQWEQVLRTMERLNPMGAAE